MVDNPLYSGPDMPIYDYVQPDTNGFRTHSVNSNGVNPSVMLDDTNLPTT